MSEASDIDRFTGQALDLLGRAEDADGPERRHALARAQVYATLAVASALRVAADTASRAEMPDGRRLFELAEQVMSGQEPPSREIARLALEEAPSLDQVLPALGHTPDLGFTTPGWEGRGVLRAVVGSAAPLPGQELTPLSADLSGAEGHVAVAGSPRSGKSTLLRTLVTSLALTHTPDEAQFYCLDLGGGSLAPLRNLPHVGGVANRLDPYRVRRTAEQVAAVLESREGYFTEHEIDSMAAYRRLRATDEILGDGFGDVFLVVDDWLVMRQEFADLEPVTYRIATRGLRFGVHLIASASSWTHFRTEARSLFGTRFELRLGDPYESEIDRKAASAVPAGRPGRGLSALNGGGGTHFQAALPRIDGSASTDDLDDGLRDLVEAVGTGWQGAPASSVRVLPESLPLRALPTATETGHRVPIGVDETTLSPVLLDFLADPHFVVVGDRGCGKSNLLRLIATSIMDRYAPSDVRLVLVDFRRSLIDLAGPHTDHAASPHDAAELLRDIHGTLAARVASSGGAKGPAIFLIVDDHHLLATADDPLVPIAELMPWSAEIGLHLVVATAMSGAGRRMYSPVLQQLRSEGGAALVMSGTREEGPLFGDVRAERLPPGRGTYVHYREGNRLIQTAHIGTEP